MTSHPVELSFCMTKKGDILLKQTCKEHNLTVTDFLGKALSLMTIILKYKNDENRLAVIDANGQKIEEVVGIKELIEL